MIDGETARSGAPLPPAFTAQLQRQRRAYNDRFAAARMATPALRGEAVLSHLAETVAPIVGAVDKVAPGAAPAVCDALYAVSLELIGRDLVGPDCRIALVNRAWRTLLGGLPHITAVAAEPFARAVTNAVHALAGHRTADPAFWIAPLADLGPAIPDLQTLQACGVVAAWRAGMAHYRGAALDAAEMLPPAMAASLLNLPELAVPKLISAWRADPWASKAVGPSRRPRQVAMVGGFRGFGGPFLTPPRVSFSDGQFIVSDVERRWEMIADRFGSTLLPIRSDENTGGNDAAATLRVEAPHIDGKGIVRFGASRAHHRALAGASSQASDGTTLAITLPLSHCVHLVALG